MILWRNIEKLSIFIILILTPDFPYFYYMLGGNLEMFPWWRQKQAFCLSPGRLLLRIVYKSMQTDGRTNTPSDERTHKQIKSQFINTGFVSLDVVNMGVKMKDKFY